MKKLIFLVMSVIVVFTGCAENVNVTDLTAEELCSKSRNNNDVLLLDARTEPEFKGHLGHLKNAVLIPDMELSGRLHEIDKFRNKAVVVYYRSGNRSVAASNFLLKNGYKEVYNLLGGMGTWNSADSTKLVCKNALLVRNLN